MGGETSGVHTDIGGMANPISYKSFAQLRGAAVSLHERDVSLKLIKEEKAKEDPSMDTALYGNQQGGGKRGGRGHGRDGRGGGSGRGEGLLPMLAGV